MQINALIRWLLMTHLQLTFTKSSPGHLKKPAGLIQQQTKLVSSPHTATVLCESNTGLNTKGQNQMQRLKLNVTPSWPSQHELGQQQSQDKNLGTSF